MTATIISGFVAIVIFIAIAAAKPGKSIWD
jgi:hypothetical protein